MLETSIGCVNCTGNRSRPGRAFQAAFIAAVWLVVAVACSGKGKPPAPTSGGNGGDASGAQATATPTATATALPKDPVEARARASALAREGSYKEAAEAYRAALAAAPDKAGRADAALGAAVATYGAGDAAAAITLLRQAVAAAPAGSDVARQSTYLLAVRLDEAGGTAKDAVALLQPLAATDTGDALEAYIRSEYARALDADGDASDANTTWDGVLATAGIPESLRTDVYEARLIAATARSDTVATRMWLGRLAALTDDPATRYELATSSLQAGDRSTFVAQLSAIISNDPGSGFASQAIADLKTAGVAVDAGSEGYVDYRRGLLADARRVLSAAIAEQGIDAATLAFRTFYLAASDEDSGRLDQAVAEYDRVAALSVDSPYRHRAMYWAARVTERQGDAEAASARYVALVLHGPIGEFTTESAFRAGYTLFAGGNAAGAISAWAQLGVSSDARLLYWEGRAYTRLNDSSSAATAYQRAATVAPLDFFGQEAAQATGSVGRIDVSYRPRTLSNAIDWNGIATWLATEIPGTTGTAPTGAAALAAVGMPDKARDIINAAASGAGAWRLLDLAHQARDAGLPDVAAQFAVRIRQATGVAPENAPRALMQLAYPVAYVDLLQKESQANGIDPLFMAALVRQESLWDAGASSSAGALGLTQVIPPTGNGIADELGVSGFTADDLLRPVVSLRFGAYYLAGQLKQYGDPLAALAAYNAGPGNAQRWVAATPRGSSGADFAESIDIGETQHYVQVIMEHYAFYELAWGP
jgi:soluble lytic murein transglycosylase